MKNIFISVITICLMIPGMIHSQNLSEKLEGSWEGKGSLMGSEADFKMNWDRILDDQFIQLTFTSKRIIDEAEVFFHATATYRLDDNKWEGTWFDSRGVSFCVVGTAEDSTLTVEWGSPDIEQGRTVYTITGENEMAVTDYVNQNGTYSKFGEALYQKVGMKNSTPGVTGIGGIFFKTNDASKTRAWYEEHLGVRSTEQGGSFVWRQFDSADDYGFTVWHAFQQDDDYFNLSNKDFMINYRVNNLDALIKKLEDDGVEFIGEVEEYPFGKFAWILDPEGQKVELWEPYDAGFFNMKSTDGSNMYNPSN